jgi:hypothetical protein
MPGNGWHGMRDQPQRVQQLKADSTCRTIAARTIRIRASLSPGAPRILIAWLALALGACATQLTQAPPSPAQPAGGKALSFQQKSLAPAGGVQRVGAESLRVGDILLSAEAAPLSSGIRLITAAPVSHAAVYVGDDAVAEALGGGVRLRSVPTLLTEESVVAVYRLPRLTEAQAQRVAELARSRVGMRYDFVGAFLYVPFSVQRQACELPALPTPLRDACIRLLAGTQLGLAEPEDRFFCSSFVLGAFGDAGVPITQARPRWLTPADILHMREGDVPALPVQQPLIYVGHLKTTPWALDLPTVQLPLPPGYPVPLVPARPAPATTP